MEGLILGLLLRYVLPSETSWLCISLWATTFRHLLLQAACAPSIHTALLLIWAGIFCPLPWGLLPVPAAAAKSPQSCPTLCNPTDGSPPCSAIPGILQARTLEWVAISFSNAWKWKVKVKSLSCNPMDCILQGPPQPTPQIGQSSRTSLRVALPWAGQPQGSPVGSLRPSSRVSRRPPTKTSRVLLQRVSRP